MGKMENPSVSVHQDNPTCGDDMELYLKIDGDRITDVKFTGTGCAISMGAASILTEYIKGKAIGEVERLKKEDLLELLGIDPGPARMHCATLSLRAAKEGAFKYEGRPVDSETKEL